MAKLLRARDVARLLNVDGGTVRGWIKSGRLPAILLPGGQYRIDPQVIDALLAQLGPQANAAPEVEEAVALADGKTKKKPGP